MSVLERPNTGPLDDPLTAILDLSPDFYWVELNEPFPQYF